MKILFTSKLWTMPSYGICYLFIGWCICIFTFNIIQLEVWEMKPASETDEAPPNWRWPLRFPMPFWIKSMEKHPGARQQRKGWMGGRWKAILNGWLGPKFLQCRLTTMFSLSRCVWSGNSRFSDFPSGCWWGFPTKLYSSFWCDSSL